MHAYPTGGGAYIVAHENLGRYPGLLAAAALLMDYVLTVSVSIVAGVDAIVSAATSLGPWKVPLSLVFVAFVTVANLRGAKESGTFFAVPTYGFVLSIYIMLASGFINCLDGCPQAEGAGTHLESQHALTLFLVLKAFSAGTTVLTGVEAISNGVPAFRYPQSRNAATTLGIMGVMTISMFVGITWLAAQTDVVYTEEMERTVVAQIAHAIFGAGFMFYVVQAMTAGILILAANTAYQDFPRLSSILAQDGFMPRQLMNRGNRLVFSNGVLILALLGSLLIVIFDARLNSLIQLYLIGVFISFTLSQWGMVVHWRRTREQGSRRRMFINGFGGTVTGMVFFVVITTKFLTGAWIVVSAIPVLMFMMHSINQHYRGVATELAHPERRPIDRRAGDQNMVIFVANMDAATARAVGYVRSVRPRTATALTFDKHLAGTWRRLAPDVPITVGTRERSLAADVKNHLQGRRMTMQKHEFLTIVVPELLERRGLIEILRRPRMHRFKASFLGEPGIQVLDVPMLLDEIDPDVDESVEPARNHVIVLVSGVHNATLEAIEYAESLRPTSVQAVMFGLDPGETEKIGNQWMAQAIPVPLEIEDSPFRDIGHSLTQYVRNFRPDSVNRMVTVVIPEFVVSKLRTNYFTGRLLLSLRDTSCSNRA